MCARSCPKGAISGKLKERHVIKSESCIECGACAAVCNQGAIQNASGIFCTPIPPAERKMPRVDAQKCVGCEYCIELCPKDALALTEPKFRGDTQIVSYLKNPAVCVGCGYCARICPQGAVTMQGRNEK